MSTPNVIGAGMIFLLFGGMFIFFAKDIGILATIGVYAATAGIAAFIGLAKFLLNYPS